MASATQCVNVRTLTGMNEASVFILNNRRAWDTRCPTACGTMARRRRCTRIIGGRSEEFAHDFTRIGANGLPYSGDGTKLTDYYAYGQPVLAAADGQVIAVLNDEPEDTTLLQRRARRSTRT